MSKKTSDAKEKEVKARLSQEQSKDHQETPASDVYSKTEGKDAETGVEIPTENAVEEAKEWVDDMNRM